MSGFIIIVTEKKAIFCEVRCDMNKKDINRKCVVYDRPMGQGNGIMGTIIDVYDEHSFRLMTDNMNEYDFSTKSGLVRVKFVRGD